MKISRYISFLILLLASIDIASAQQNLGQRRGVTSPEVHDDGSVTIRLFAPKAQEVLLKGDFVADGCVAMCRCEDGVWEYHSAPLASELYCYRLAVDGMGDICDPASSYVMRDVSTLMSYFIIGGGRGDDYRAQEVAHGSVNRVWAKMSDGCERRMTIYTPADYEESDARYPVLYLLHGMGGDEEAWLATGRAAEIMDNLIAAGRAEKMIVVMTNGCTRHVSAPGYSHEGMWAPYMSGSMDGSFEALFPEIVTWIDKHYRTVASASHRAIAGLSMGGFHAMYISMSYPADFDYVGLFSAAIYRGEEGVDIYEAMNESLARQFAQGPQLYWIGIGKDDFLYEENLQYRAQLDSCGYRYIYHESTGGHEWRNWRCYLVEFAERLFK